MINPAEVTTKSIKAICDQARMVAKHPWSSRAAQAKALEVIDLLSDGAQPTRDEARALLKGLRRLYATAELVQRMIDDLPSTGEVQ